MPKNFRGKCGIVGCQEPVIWQVYESKPRAANVFRMLSELVGPINPDYIASDEGFRYLYMCLMHEKNSRTHPLLVKYWI